MAVGSSGSRVLWPRSGSSLSRPAASGPAGTGVGPGVRPAPQSPRAGAKQLLALRALPWLFLTQWLLLLALPALPARWPTVLTVSARRGLCPYSPRAVSVGSSPANTSSGFFDVPEQAVQEVQCMGPAGSKAVLVPRGNPAWTRHLCGAHHFPQPCAGTAAASQLCEGSKAALAAVPGLALSHHRWQSLHSRVGWAQGSDAPCVGSGSRMQHNTAVLGMGLSQPLSCWGLPSSQPQAPNFPIPGHLLLFLMVPGWHHPITLRSPTTGPSCSACSTLPRASRHGPRTAQGCPRDSLPVGHRDTGTVPALSLQGPACPGPVLSQAHAEGTPQS